MLDYSINFSYWMGFTTGIGGLFAALILFIVLDSLMRRSRRKIVYFSNFRLGLMSFVGGLLLVVTLGFMIFYSQIPANDLYGMKGSVTGLACFFLMSLLSLKGAVTPE